MQNKREFEVEVDGVKTKFAVLRPNHKVQQKGQQVYNRAFRDAAEAGAFVKQRIRDVMKDQNLWDDTKQKRDEELRKSLLQSELKLKKGGIPLKEAREIALQMGRDRWELRELNYQKHQLEMNSAEAQAENARFNYLVSACTVYLSNGKTVFEDHEDYLERGEEPVAIEAASQLGMMLYSLDTDFEKKLPENKFLLKYKMVDDKLRFVDKDGNYTDVLGRRVDDQGRLINEAGELIDSDGNRLTPEGEFIIDEEPFYDDDGNPVDVDDSVAVAVAKVEPMTVKTDKNDRVSLPA